MSGLFAHCIKLGVFAPVDKIYFMSECDSEDLDQGFHYHSSTADICGKYHWKNWTVGCSRDRDRCIFPTIHPKKVKMQKNVDCLVKLFMSDAPVSSPQLAWRCRPRPGPEGVLMLDDGPVCSLLCCPAPARNVNQQSPSNKSLSNIQLDMETDTL